MQKVKVLEAGVILVGSYILLEWLLLHDFFSSVALNEAWFDVLASYRWIFSTRNE